MTEYNVKVVGDGPSIDKGSTSCNTSQCVSVQKISALASSYYNISVASINGDGLIGPENTTTINGEQLF